ncbi:MAG: double-cubane-cluster-containing anaerobic reductase [Candidatus Zixiibacteriota bacterium]
MSQDYTKMWSDLGLDLPTHDALLTVLGKAYGDIFMSQRNRPEGMKYFDFVMSEVHGLRIKELIDAQSEGRKIIGSFCVFVPEEIILAADAVSVGLCAGAEFGFEEAEQYLPRSTCSLIKSFFGFKLTRVCPYIEACDMIVGENTCDGKKKAYEIFDDLVENLYVMDVPQVKHAQGRALLKMEYARFITAVERLTGVKITPERLKKGIEIVNAKRRAVHRLAQLRAADPAPISGLDALIINQVYFYDDPVRFTESVNKICDELDERIAKRVGAMDAGKPRILISGCPMAVPNWKIPAIVEGAGAVIVGEESCVGERGTRNETAITGETVDAMLEGLVDRYFKIDCAIFTPNQDRLQHVKEMAKAYGADGVIHYGLQFCTPYTMEAGPMEKKLEDDGIPVLRLETDYSQEDAGQISTRVEAFIERISE